MFRLRDRRVQIVLAFVLLPLLGLATYQIVVNVWAGRQYDAASRALENYDYEQAGAYLDGYLSVHPTDPETLLLAAQTARRRGDFPEALRLLSRAEKQGAPAEAVGAERQLLQIQGGELTDAGALAQFCSDHADDPNGALAMEVLIEGGLKGLKPSLARWAVDLWLAHRPGKADQVQGLLWRGRVYEFIQDFPHALADFRKAVELAPDNAGARLRLAETLIREEPREAAVHLDWLRRARPDDPEVRFQTARLRRSLGQTEDAARLLDEVLASAPDRVPVLVERGRVAMELNQPAEAERWLLRALSLAPELREVNLALGDCLRQAGRPDEAKRYQDKVQEIDARLQKALDKLTRNGGTRS